MYSKLTKYCNFETKKILDERGIFQRKRFKHDVPVNGASCTGQVWIVLPASKLSSPKHNLQPRSRGRRIDSDRLPNCFRLFVASFNFLSSSLSLFLFLRKMGYEDRAIPVGGTRGVHDACILGQRGKNSGERRNTQKRQQTHHGVSTAIEG